MIPIFPRTPVNSGPLQAKYSIQRNSIVENNKKNKAYGQLRYRTKH